MSFKRIFLVTVAVLSALALGAAIALVLLTSYLHRLGDTMNAAMQGMHLAEELQVQLLDHWVLSDQRASFEPSPFSELSLVEQGMRQRLAAVKDFSSSPEEERLIQEVERTVDAYLRERRTSAPAPLMPDVREDWGALVEAQRALRRYVEYTVLETRSASEQSSYLNRLADIVGFTVAAVLLVGVSAVLLLFNRFAIRPTLAVGEAMRRFGIGRKRIRAPVAGPTEVREIAQTFNEMANSLARQRETQLTWLAAIAHELRNPLSALKVSTALIAPGRGDVSPERIQRTLALVRRQVARLDRLVGDLLDASRIEAGKLELHKEDRDARDLAREVVELFLAGEPDHELRLLLPDEPVLVRADPTRIEQVLNNLVSNALKYSPAGSRVDVAVRREGDEAVFSVTDQGIGMSAEERRSIFAPYRRTGSARQRAPGVGLGLSVSRRIIEAHGGRIEVESQLGRGSTFRIRLALVPAARAQAEAWSPDAEGPPGTLH